MATGGYFIGFACPVIGLLILQIRKRWRPGRLNFGRVGIVLTVAATIWIVFETINIAWPRNPNLIWYQNWAVVVGVGALAAVGAIYYFITRPDRKFTLDAESSPKSGPTDSSGGSRPMSRMGLESPETNQTRLAYTRDSEK
jgi:amino acid transporter